MTYTESDLLKLKEALLTGASSVSIGDRTITFRSQADLLKLIESIQTNLQAEDEDWIPTSNTVQATWRKK